MNLLLIGTSHKLADVSSRERLAASIGEVRSWLARARDRAPAVEELFVLATCHRVECYAAVTDVAAAGRQIVALVDDGGGAPLLGGDAPHDVRHDEDAVRHLCRVVCGLESVIVGEAEISGQVRRAAAVSRAAGTLGPYLERVVAGALRCGGRARTETHIGRGVVSAASAGVTLAVSLLGTLAGRSVLVVGAGQAGRQILARLARIETGPLFVASRSDRHARQAAAPAGAGVVPIDRVAAQVAEVDVVLAATTASSPVFEAAACGSRARRPLLVVDLSVPRAIDPAVGQLPGVTLRTIEDLGDIARESLARRVQEVPRVEALAREEAGRAWQLLRARAARRSRQIS